jgi:hypothetical protein
MGGFNLMEIAGAAKAMNGLGGLSAGCPALVEHAAVGKLQERMSSDKAASVSDPEVQDLTGGLGSDGVDRKYGDNTHTFALKWIDWTVRQGRCSETSQTEWSRNGPNAARTCLMGMGFSAAEVDELQAAWNEYRVRESCLARNAPHDEVPPSSNLPTAAPTATKSKRWIWILGGVVLVVGGIAYVATRD